MSASGCPRCGGAVGLHAGKPSVTSDGQVALWHPDCWELRDVPLPVAEASAVPVAESWARSWLGVARRTVRDLSPRGRIAAAAAVVAFVAGAWLIASWWPLAADAVPALAAAAREPLAIRSSMVSRDDAPPRWTRTVRPIGEGSEIPLVDGTPLDELFPTLKDWVHPVTASAEYMPTFPPRLFGAERVGIERAECGAGHCGVDLDGPRGRPLVSVAAGIVVNVERSERGADGRSGRYVRIQHEDGTFTAYMHMDDVAEDLSVGVAVRRGQYVGTLGATAVYSAPPHLHFSLEVPNQGGGHYSALSHYVATHYVNPAPFLLRATIAPVIERPNRPALY